jgi:hypothetical protein
VNLSVLAINLVDPQFKAREIHHSLASLNFSAKGFDSVRDAFKREMGAGQEPWNDESWVAHFVKRFTPSVLHDFG